MNMLQTNKVDAQCDKLASNRVDKSQCLASKVANLQLLHAPAFNLPHLHLTL